MVRDWQMEPVKGSLLHVDFLRVALDERLRVKVPMHTRGEAKGVKQEGGILEVIHREVEVECLPTDIPEEFVVDVSELGINQSIRAKDLPIDASKLRLLTDANQVLVHVVMPRAVEEEKPAEEVVVDVVLVSAEVGAQQGDASQEGNNDNQVKPTKTQAVPPVARRCRNVRPAAGGAGEASSRSLLEARHTGKVA